MYVNSKKNNNLTVIIGGIIAFILVIGIIFGVIFFGKEETKSNQDNNLGKIQRQQVREAASQLVENILDNQNNFNQLTINSNGTRRNIDEIEEVFLLGTLSKSPPNSNQPIPSNISFSPQVIELSWYELRPFIIAGLQNLNQSLLENVRLRIKNDIEKWLKWELEKTKGDYDRLLNEYLRVIQELKTIKELFEQYTQLRTNLVINKVNCKDELIAKGYSEKDIEQLKEWNLLEQNFPNLYDDKRIGVTNTLSVSCRDNGYGEQEVVGGSSNELLLFLKSSNHANSQTNINFPPNKISDSQQKSVREIINNLLQNSPKLGQELKKHDIYILRLRTGNTTYTGPSSGVAHYLALYSALHQTPLPRNLASTGAIEESKVGPIGGLRHKLEAAVKKEKSLNIFILSEANFNKQGYQKFKPGYVTKDPEENWFENFPSSLKEKVKQVHFISQVNQIEIALQEILKEPERKIVHSCNKEENPTPKPENPNPRGPPQPDNPNSEITSEQLLSLIVELKSREKGDLGDHKDFWEKLKVTYSEDVVFQEIVKKLLNFYQAYLARLEKINSNPPNQRRSDLERQKLVIFKEYQAQLQTIAASVSDDTINEILIKLTNLGYDIVAIRWVGELLTPHLNFSYQKNRLT